MQLAYAHHKATQELGKDSNKIVFFQDAQHLLLVSN